jgi:sporulation protein YlmC with PRC-barrel domain
MKTIQKTILISLVPLLMPINAFGEPNKNSDIVYPLSEIKGSADSWRASQVMGLNVKNSANESIGEVEDLLLDMSSGDIVAVIISSGGFLGIADTLSAVPVTAIRYDGEAKAFKTKLTKDQLGKAPQFKSNAWPDYNEAALITSLRSYRDSIGGDVNAPDNTAQNEKDKNQNTTPTDQGNSEKGVVESHDEHQMILKIAKNHANSAKITDDLKVNDK